VECLQFVLISLVLLFLLALVLPVCCYFLLYYVNYLTFTRVLFRTSVTGAVGVVAGGGVATVEEACFVGVGGVGLVVTSCFMYY
jgi:hypothetical protein